MFTGIVQDIGTIVSIDKTGDWTVAIAVANPPLDKLALGASVACNGICLTVTQKTENMVFKVQVSAETLSRTTALHWKLNMPVNLESALRMGDELGGHLVSGHIDGIASVKEKHMQNSSIRYIFEVPHEFSKFIASKGSIALDGVSLTINEVEGARFGVNVIPHTQNWTTLGKLEPGNEVNFEVDLIARYTERLLNQRTTK